jgi:hypothetical protein
MVDFAKIKELADKAAKTGADMTKAQTGGGGDYKPPAAGPCALRFTDYIELGKHVGSYQGAPKTNDEVLLGFECHGPNHPPLEVDGKKLPQKVWVELNKSLNQKAGFFKLFQLLNFAGKATHITQLLGDGYMGTVVHRKYKKKTDTEATGPTGIAVELSTKENGFTLRPPRRELLDEATGLPNGQYAAINVPAPIGPFRMFLWDLADLDQWSSIHIEGAYPERKDAQGNVTAPAKSKNVHQERIRRAINFNGSPIYAALAASGGSLDIPDAETPDTDSEGPGKAPGSPATPAAGAAQGDPLAGIA